MGPHYGSWAGEAGRRRCPPTPDARTAEGTIAAVSVLVVTDERFLDHRPGERHPERPARLEAVWSGLDAAGLGDAVVRRPAEEASDEDLLRCHPVPHLARLVDLDAAGGGRVDADTKMSTGSWTAARLAAGAGLVAVAALRNGEAETAFCAVRPPGHHATPTRTMGFCLLNNVAVTAMALADAGERVAIVDFDAHHGNGTQEAFYSDDRVLFVSCHQWPLYPGTGAPDEVGEGAGTGTTVNLALPPEAAGDTYRHALDAVVVPIVERFAPDWLLVSAGFDAHRADPLTRLGLTSGDFADLTDRLVGLARTGRSILFLEGGYDLDALSASAGAAVAAAVGVDYRPEAASSEGPGREAVESAVVLHGLVVR
ncbi:MAG: histone deacetylase [Actinomycetia bacterium]|nr:histone deacetylase [Actinomycetes bacterium]